MNGRYKAAPRLTEECAVAGAAHEGTMIDPSRLLCALGGHRADAGIVWNHGYAFSRCRRCERDIVRSLFGRWRLPPRGCRIVWRPADSLADSHHARFGTVTGDYRSRSAVDFMDDDGADFRWIEHLPPRDRDVSRKSYDFMRDEPRSPRARRQR